MTPIYNASAVPVFLYAFTPLRTKKSNLGLCFFNLGFNWTSIYSFLDQCTCTIFIDIKFGSI